MSFDDDVLAADPDVRTGTVATQPVPWMRRAVSAAKQRARRKGIPFNIDAVEMLEQYRDQNGECYWFRVPLGAPEGHPYHPLAPSLDRVDSDCGYTHGNVVWTCFAANTAKRDTDPECWEDFLSLLAACLGVLVQPTSEGVEAFDDPG